MFFVVRIIESGRSNIRLDDFRNFDIEGLRKWTAKGLKKWRCFSVQVDDRINHGLPYNRIVDKHGGRG